VRAATHRALAARDHLLRDYPHWEEWRLQARALKAEAIARMDEFLEQLQRAVTAWGGQVLWARDAAQARELILEVARQHRIQTVVKSKSMTTEEIGLNPALAAAGIQTRETDLGEFIVQLAGHPPAHLTAPALHLNRYQIAGLFREHLGSAASLAPEDLTRQATDFLKPLYGEAQMGITGVNFATPDGTLVLLENENNLRLTATLPPVHLALMGLEKIIPTLASLEIFLRLLPASATGQRLTALVHFIQGLKPQGRGNQAFYLVLLDNGRRRLAADPDLAEALYCLRCGACLNACPIFQVGGAHLYGRIYPGAIGILLAPYLAPRGEISDLCTQCGACQEICPVHIRLAEKILLARRRSPRFRRVRAVSGAAGQLLTRPRVYRPVESGCRRLAALFPGGADFFKTTLSPESFHQQYARRGGGFPGSRPRRPASTRMDTSPVMAVPVSPPEAQAPEGPTDPDPFQKLTARMSEARGSLYRARGPAALARLLASRGPLWLEDHPWLREVAAALEGQGVATHLLGETPTPETWTAVVVALGAVPETASVLVESGGPATAAGLSASQLVLVLPPGRADLTLPQALELTGRRRPAMMSWLTGPSRTADIEKVLVVGAQGPKEVDLVLYEAEA
jgi:L-lactate dehydrogenase complex protein LldF